ncbi:MAG: hypothetical protein ABIH50_07745 [bacterium]
MLNIFSTSPKNSEAEKLLKKNGYEILSRNKKESVVIHYNGKDHFSSLEADYVARKAKQRFVVFEKKGEGSIDPTEPALRRKLIELERVFGLNGILLVDPEEGEIEPVTFKFPKDRGLDFYFQFLAALCIIGIVIGIIWLMAWVKLF